MVSINLAKFELPGKIFPTNTVRKVCKNWLIDNYKISNKIKLITSIITSSKTAMANHFKESIDICLCQVSKIEVSDKNDIKKISNEIIHNYKQIISKDRELSEIIVDIDNTGYNSKDNNLVGALKSIHRKILIKK